MESVNVVELCFRLDVFLGLSSERKTNTHKIRATFTHKNLTLDSFQLGVIPRFLDNSKH